MAPNPAEGVSGACVPTYLPTFSSAASYTQHTAEQKSNIHILMHTGPVEVHTEYIYIHGKLYTYGHGHLFTSYPSDAVRVALFVSVRQTNIAEAQNTRSALHPNFGKQTERGGQRVFGGQRALGLGRVRRSLHASRRF